MKKAFKSVFGKKNSQTTPDTTTLVQPSAPTVTDDIAIATSMPSVGSPSRIASALTSARPTGLEFDANSDVFVGFPHEVSLIGNTLTSASQNVVGKSANISGISLFGDSQPTSVTNSPSIVIGNLPDAGIVNISGRDLYNYNVTNISIIGSAASYTTSAASQMTNLFLSAKPPPVPEVFHGRDDYISQAVSLIRTTKFTHIAILGSGGIGKTSVSLAILHHEDVQQIFQDRRYYVPCEAATSPELLLQYILQVLGVQQQGSSSDPLCSLHNCLSASPLLLVLDNFETPWEESDDQSAVESILQRVAAVEHVSLLVAMRGAESPTGVKWTEPQTLPPLSSISLDAARAAFLEMAGNQRPCEELDLLLQELDGVPLAIKLVAQLGKTSSCTSLLKLWRSQKTSFLNLRGPKSGRLASIDVSVAISLKHAVEKSGEWTLQLLGLISYLPDGVFEWETTLGEMLPSFQNLEYVVGVLLRAALVYDYGAALKVLSPIRHYMLEHHSPSESDLKEMEKYYVTLVNRSYNADDNTINRLAVEQGNVISVFRSAIKNHAYVEVANAAYNMSRFTARGGTKVSIDLLVEMMPLLEHLGLGEREPFFLKDMADALYLKSQYPEATEHFEMARNKFTAAGNQSEAATCLWRLGGVLVSQRRLTEAFKNVTMAKEEFSAIGGEKGVARCLHTLGIIYTIQRHFTEADTNLRMAMEQYMAIGGCELQIAQCQHNLAEVLRGQGKRTEAVAYLRTAVDHFVAVGDMLGAANCLHCSGEILADPGQDKFELATKAVELAKEVFSSIGYQLECAQCQSTLGLILKRQRKYTEAAEQFEQAFAQLNAMGDPFGAGHCLVRLADMFRIQGKYKEATETFVKAQERFAAIDDQEGPGVCMFNLGMIAFEQENYQEAARMYSAARDWYRTVGMEKEAAGSEGRYNQALEQLA